jgi:hypothetical protein
MMADKRDNPVSSGQRGDGEDGERYLSSAGVAIVMTIVVLVCIGGYFLVMKLIDVNRQEECLMAGRRNCFPAEVPSGR